MSQVCPECPTATRELEADHREIIALAVGLVASVSAANLKRRGQYLPSTLVNPFTLRELADAIEARYPGLIEKCRTA
jgi:hypothetical protein